MGTQGEGTICKPRCGGWTLEIILLLLRTSGLILVNKALQVPSTPPVGQDSRVWTAELSWPKPVTLEGTPGKSRQQNSMGYGFVTGFSGF